MIQKLYLHNFRNYNQVEIEFSPKLNLIKGNNAQGKTNLLEALFFLSTGRSFRTLKLSDLICWDKPFFYIEAEFVKEGIVQTLKVSFDGQTKKVRYNNTDYSHFANLLGMLPTVVLTPEDINLITGAPEQRRRFLDLHIAQIDPLYVYHISRYFKALKQRNCLLRQQKNEGIESWEQLLVSAGSYIQQRRIFVIQALQKPLASIMHELSKGEDVIEMYYLPSSTKNYEEIRSKEMRLGATLIGPHRDDLSFTINGKEAKAFSSQGQKRSAITALKLAQWNHFAATTGSPPILSIDDFGIHLDTRRHEQLLEQVKDRGQLFLTSPYPLKEAASRLIFIERGEVTLT